MDKPEVNKNSEFIKTNLKWLVGIIFAIIMLWLNSKYETKDEAAKHDLKFDKLEMEFELYKQTVDNLVKVIDEITELKIKDK